MDGSDEYTNTTFDDSDKDKAYEPPPDEFRPEFVPQMQRGGNTSESEHGDAILSGKSKVHYLHKGEEVIQQDSVADDDTTQVNEDFVRSYNISFTSDNAGDISKALRKLGKFKCFGCAGHYLNLVA